MRFQNRIILLVGVVELVILFVFAIIIVRQPIVEVDTDLSQWSSKYISFENGSWSVNAGELNVGEIDLIYGPYVECTRGGYTVDVTYECDVDQKLKIYATSGNAAYIKENTITLSKNVTSISYDFELTKDIDNLEVVVKYSGDGACKINDISITSNRNILKRKFVYLFLLLGILDILYAFFDKIKENKKLILVIMGITLCTSIPLFVRGMDSGHDEMFHLMRIEGIATELKYGNFPARIQSLWMDGYGYAVSIYYGDLLLYFPAILRLAGFPVTICLKSYLFLINLGTSILGFYSFNKVFKKKNSAIILTLVYMTASYRLENMYVRVAVGEFTAMMFLPIVAAAIYEIYTDSDSAWKHYKHNAFLLALGMTGLIGNHILSTEMVCTVLVLVCVALLSKTFRKNTIRVYILAVIDTLFLSLYFLVPFFDYYMNCYVNINNTVNNTQMIQNAGVYLAQYFLFWHTVFGQNTSAVADRFQMTPGFILMMVLVIAFIIWYRGKATSKVKILTVFSAIFLFVSSNIFPWDFIAEHSVIGNFLAQVQFPWRYLSIAIVFLTMLLGELLDLMPESLWNVSGELFKSILCVVCVIMVCWFSSDYCNNMSVVNYYETAELNNKRIMNKAEYLIVNTDRNLLSNDIVTKNMGDVKLVKRIGNYFELSCSVAETEGYIELPLYNYKGYKVVDQAGNQYAITNGTNNVVAFLLPAGFSGIITVKFVEPWYWRIAMCISILYAMWRGVRVLKELRIPPFSL